MLEIFQIQFMKHRDVGEPLYLTPYIQRGEIEIAQELSKIVDPLVGIDPDDQPDNMHSGFFTVNEQKGNHLFFWFIPATVRIWSNC